MRARRAPVREAVRGFRWETRGRSELLYGPRPGMRARRDDSEICPPTPPLRGANPLQNGGFDRPRFCLLRVGATSVGLGSVRLSDSLVQKNFRSPRLLTDRSVDRLSFMASTMDRANAGLREVQVADSRDKILEIAESLFASGGYAGVGMRRIAATVGLSKSSLFHHFPTKLDLYGDVLDRVLERIERGLDEGALGAGGPVERLDRWIDSVVATLAEDVPAARLLMRALVDEEPYPAVALASDEREWMRFEVRLAGIIDRFRGLLEEGIAAGQFRSLGVPDAIQSVIGAVVFLFASGDLGGVLIGEVALSGAAVERRRREVSEFIRRGLLA
ncbi:MAG: hypothetical protein CL908_09400 [Deltaproteobacteria bacterium]|nr:hypothetical protein [Deltaproteobacteria bacterium]